MHIACQRCSTVLTQELAWVEPSVRNMDMGIAPLPFGKITQEDGSYFHEQKGVYIANSDAGINMSLTDDPKRTNGCCGLDGCDGPNLLCDTCHNYVATRTTDCWTPHCIVFDPRATIAQLETAVSSV